MNRRGVRLRTPLVEPTIVRARPEPRSATTQPAWPVLLVWIVLVVAARLVLVDLVQSGAHLRIPFPPLDASLDWRPGWVLVLPAALGVLVVVRAPAALARWSWSQVVWVSAAVSGAWGISLALLDGVHGVTGSVTLKNEYFLDLGRVGDPFTFLREFTARISEYRIHVQGHPPGFLLLLSVLDRIGLGHPTLVAAIEIAGGAMAVAAVLVATRDVAGEAIARRAAPFVAIAPVAIWMTTSTDAFYAGVGAWAVALVVLATGRARRADAMAAAGGLLFGAAAFLSYGLVLLAALPITVAIARRRVRVLVIAALGAGLVFAVFALAGFWWFDGLAATRARYDAGVAAHRPYGAFALVDLACLAIAMGPAVAVGLSRVRDRRVWLLVGSTLLAVGLALLSGMSKGEVERIWLPFAVWLLPAGYVLTGSRRSGWLALQIAFTIGLQTLVRSPW
jgi:hypothetical protein